MTKQEAFLVYKSRGLGGKVTNDKEVKYAKMRFEGEWAFAKLFGVQDMILNPDASEWGVNLKINDHRISIKTFDESSCNVINDEAWVDTRSCRKDVIYVIALFLARRSEAIFVGWEFGDMVNKWPVVVSPWDSKNYSCPLSLLKHPWYLYEEIEK